MRILLVDRKLSVLERCPYGGVQLYPLNDKMLYFATYVTIITITAKNNKTKLVLTQIDPSVPLMDLLSQV